MKNVEGKICSKCNNRQTIDKFIKGTDKDGRCFICTPCRNKIKTLAALKKYCIESKRNFSPSLWNLVLETSENRYKDKIKNLEQKQKGKYLEEKAIKLYFSKMNLDNVFTESEVESDFEEEETVTTSENIKKITPEMVKKWGSGYKSEEYWLFEEKYQRLKNSFQLPTESHREFLQKACVCSVKADMAMAKGEFKEAKEWMTMFKDVTQAGKLQPSQMSKADLSGGMDTFGQLTRMVEQNVDIIPILPKFKKKPQDAVDFNIWCYTNYIRQLMDLPLCEYEDVYRFYEERKKDFETSRNHLQSDEEGDF